MHCANAKSVNAKVRRVYVIGSTLSRDIIWHPIILHSWPDPPLLDSSIHMMIYFDSHYLVTVWVFLLPFARS
jgi:hypothetical protein